MYKGRLSCSQQVHDMHVLLQRGITRLKRFNLSKIYGSVAGAGAVGPRCFTLLRSQADVPGGNGTRIYICVINAARQAIHVLSLSAAEVTYIGDLSWPADPDQILERDLLCATHSLPVSRSAVHPAPFSGVARTADSILNEASSMFLPPLASYKA